MKILTITSSMNSKSCNLIVDNNEVKYHFIVHFNYVNLNQEDINKLYTKIIKINTKIVEDNLSILEGWKISVQKIKYEIEENTYIESEQLKMEIPLSTLQPIITINLLKC